MMTKIKNEKIYRAIELCKNKILNFNDYYNINNKNFNLARTFLSLTGPHLLYESLSNDADINKSIKLFHYIKNNSIHEYQKFLIEYNNNLFITKQFKGYLNKNHYPDLWYKKEILYYNHISYNNYSFFVYPNTNNKYEFYILNNNNLLIKREINNNENLSLKIISELDNKIYYFDIIFSNKLFTLFKTNGLFSYNQNIQYIESFKIIDSEYNDKFETNIILHSNNKKIIIVKRIDSEEGWNQDLKLSCCLLPEFINEYNNKVTYKNLIEYYSNTENKECIDIHIGPSKDNYIIKEI